MLLLLTGLTHATPGARAAATPATHEVLVGQELSGLGGSDGDELSAVSLRFLPEEIDVHQGDTIHFVSAVPLQGIALLPPTGDPECAAWTIEAASAGTCAARQWLEEWAFDLRDPWYPIGLDPDDQWGKVNNAAAFPPYPACGGPAKGGRPEQQSCQFPLTPERQELQDQRWGFSQYRTSDNTPSEIRGVLGSGLRQAVLPRELDFRVTITADPGATIWAVSLFAKEAHLRITVVDADQPIATQAELDAERDTLLDADRAAARRLDGEATNHRRLTVERGVRTWEVLHGVEEGAVALRQSYPKVLEIKRGDRVRWSTARVRSLVHTVTFPATGELDPQVPLTTTMCDLDGDEPAVVGALADEPSLLPEPAFCPGGWSQVEFDIAPLGGFPSTDGTFRGHGDEDHSGVKGMAPTFTDWDIDILPDEPFTLTFDRPSDADGFAYGCALHVALGRTMSGRVIVR